MSAASDALGLRGLYGAQEALMAEVEDFQVVVHLEDGGCYEWTTFVALWSPRARRFYWIGGSGCSCDSLADDVYTLGDFQDGDRAALARALDAFAVEHRVSAAALTSAQADLRAWKKPRS